MTTGSASAPRGKIKVLSTVAVQGLLQRLAPEFEHATGHELAITFNVVKLFQQQLHTGEPFDVGIFTNFVTDDLIKEGRIVAGTRTDIARSGIALAVRAGAEKPDIRGVTDFTRALLAAKSVVYPKDGISGVYFAEILKRLGIDEEMGPRTILDVSGGLVATRVASGEAQYAVQLASELLPVRGCDLVGLIPSALQHYVTLTAGVSANAENAEASTALLAFLTASTAIAAMRTLGLEPV
jgi:molybdate transport system substrate-binding protein